ncbi:hypothetical protein LF41_2800 [Lysobacter dokdonensis DS-58]|uniref:Transmembrane protein n=1 Tax=Lysobacter dokdonensis DS-58 TaxID=1300345 RepID=A0A0A2WMN5_9GAMM|nr:hypothetical protein [Lysobacter dokdonensis]KGQ19540.1 hypothetical protein LF41_2800 [Lysobacter dokdonensis DS-58]
MHVRPAWSPSPTLAPTPRAWPAWAVVALGGSALALADLGFVSVYWFLHSGVAPVRIGQGIASWVVGSQAAHAGGLDAAIAGALLYCATVAAMVAGYMRIAARWPRLHARAWFAGTVYGIAMYGLLFEVLVPYVSAASVGNGHAPVSWTLACLVSYAGIGIGCAAIARSQAR